MLKVKLPDGSVREYSKSIRPIEIAAEIGPGLAKATLAAEVDGKVVGAAAPLPSEGEVSLRLLTKKDPEALAVMRHSAAHVMARAVMRLFDGVQLAFGPTTDHGFYYDFELKRPLSEEDFPAIEAEMAKIIKLNEPFERLEEPRERAVAICQDLGQTLKVEHINEGLADHPSLSFYRQGEFIDLCRGPHIPSAGAIGAFKLLSIAGAYWKGDASRQQLQRVYATAWFSQAELDEHLKMVEEAKRRDHRVLGKQLELFATTPLVGAGLVLWLPKGAAIRGLLESFVREELVKRGYQSVYTPNIGRVQLYETSGHFPYYADSQFPLMFDHPLAGEVQTLLSLVPESDDAKKRLVKLFEEYHEKDVPPALRLDIAGFDSLKSTDDKVAAIVKWLADRERYLLKPMNCPHHIMIYKSKPRSYRDLPVRLAEFGTVYRYEQSGELGGMTRVRGFTQDDAHLFCTEEQVADEFRGCIEMTQAVLKALGMHDYRVRLGFRDPKSDKYVGSEATWKRAEEALESVCRAMNLPHLDVERGEAAFYGPKADFVVSDCLGREWQLGTVQLDYNLPSPERFGLEYVGADNQPHCPVMIHRAPLGSLERFVGVLIEHFAGAFPLWLAPEQVRVLTVSEKSETYGREVEQKLRAAGLRVEGDFRAEKLGSKIRDAQLELIPYMLVVGPRDAEQGTVSVRDRIDGDLGAMSLDQAIAKLRDEVAQKLVRQVAKKSSTGLGERGEAHEY